MCSLVSSSSVADSRSLVTARYGIRTTAGTSNWEINYDRTTKIIQSIANINLSNPKEVVTGDPTKGIRYARIELARYQKADFVEICLEDTTYAVARIVDFVFKPDAATEEESLAVTIDWYTASKKFEYREKLPVSVCAINKLLKG